MQQGNMHGSEDPECHNKDPVKPKKEKILVLEVKFECPLKVQAENYLGHSLIPESVV